MAVNSILWQLVWLVRTALPGLPFGLGLVHLGAREAFK